MEREIGETFDYKGVRLKVANGPVLLGLLL